MTLLWLVPLLCVTLVSSDVICPYKECSCTNDVIDCSGRGLTQLPTLNSTLLNSTQIVQMKLDISNNSITAINDAQLPCGLQVFITHDNPITSMSNNAFNCSTSTLHTLVVSSSRLSGMPASFRQLTALTSLTWNNNLLTHIPDLSEFTNLLHLDLSSNSFRNSPSDKFPASLLELHLGMNSFTSIPPSVSDLSSLATLDMQDNNIESIDDFIFPNQLQNLKLSKNYFTKLTDITFKGTNPGLTTLDLSNNPLKNIDKSAFSSTLYLTDLDISSTSFLHLPQALTSLTNLRRLTCDNMVDLVCDCTEVPMVKWYSALTSLVIQGQCGDSSDLKTTLDYLSQFCPNNIFG